MAEQFQGLRPFEDDIIQTFKLESGELRGRYARLGASIDKILSQHDYPEPVAVMLGETVALAAILASSLKYQGVFSVQAKSDGPIRMLVADVTSTGDLRGYAAYDEERVAGAANGLEGNPVPRLMGAGHLAFTVDQGPETERYQGIVELDGGTLAECAHHYFRQSEQLATAMSLAAGQVREDDGQLTWRAAGMMIQRMPADEHDDWIEEDEAEEGWREAVVKLSTVTSKELLDPRLATNDLLFRLFHETGVRVWQPSPIAANCRCSRERVANVLASLPRDEIFDCKEPESDAVVVVCQFCNARYVFDDDDLEALYEPPARQ